MYLPYSVICLPPELSMAPFAWIFCFVGFWVSTPLPPYNVYPTLAILSSYPKPFSRGLSFSGTHIVRLWMTFYLFSFSYYFPVCLFLQSLCIAFSN